MSLDRLRQLQRKITGLLLFFEEIANYVDIAVRDTTDPDGLLDEVEVLRDLEPAEKAECFETSLYMTTVSIKARFMIMHKIAQTYTQVSMKHIMPGFKIVDSVSATDLVISSPEVSRRSATLSDYSMNATAELQSLVLEVSGQSTCPVTLLTAH
jgi:hypothetical protein